MANGATIEAHAVSGAPRVNVLATPSVGTGRLVILIAAMLAADLFIGTAVFNVVAGGSLRAAAAECSRLTSGQPDRLDAFSMCVAPVAGQRAFFAVSAVAMVALSAMAVVFVTPVVIERRRGLRLPGPSLAMTVQRVQALAQDTQLRRPPTVVIGPTTLQNAFCYGRPGRCRIALPTDLAINPSSAGFDTAVRHELARIAHRDIALSSITRLAWYQVTALLLLPITLSLARGDLSILPNYAWRATVLAAVVLLAQRAALRFRKYDAVLRADQISAAKQSMITVLSLVWGPSVTLLRCALARHPSVTARLDVLRNPERATAITFADGVVAAFLASIIVPCLDGVFQVVFSSGAHVNLVPVVSAILVGLVIGATTGLGLCRESLISRATGTRAPITKVTLGMFIGSMMGQAVSFAGITPSSVDGSDRTSAMFIVALSVAGTAVVAAGLSDIWTGITSYFGRPRKDLLLATVFSTSLFSVMAWANDILRTAVALGGWSLTSEELWATLTNAWVTVLAVTLAAAAGWGLWATTKAGMREPALLVRPKVQLCWAHGIPRMWQTLVVSAISGIAATTVAVGFHMMASPPHGQGEQLQQFHTDVWLTAVVGAVAALALSLINGVQRCGASLLAVPVTAAIVSAGFFILNATLGGAFTPNPSFRILAPAIALSFLLYVATAWLALIAPWIRVELRATLVITFVTVVATGAALGILGERDILIPKFDQSSTAMIAAQAIRDYKTRIGPDLFTRHLQLNRKSLMIDVDLSLSNASRGALYRGEIIAPLRQVLAHAESYVPPNDRVATVHQHCVRALRLAVAANENLALGYELNNQIILIQGLTMLDTEFKEWQTWRDAASHL